MSATRTLWQVTPPPLVTDRARKSSGPTAGDSLGCKTKGGDDGIYLTRTSDELALLRSAGD